MLARWTTREKKLVVAVIVLSCLLLSMFFATWFKKENSIEEKVYPVATLPPADKEQEELGIEELETFSEEKNRPESKQIVVDIKGAVQRPYVYVMTEQDRVIDVIDQAGGLRQDASTATINLAQILIDGMVIYIPTLEEESRLREEGNSQEVLSASFSFPALQMDASAHTNSTKVNINTASASELEQLPGIGPSRAKAIITYREEQGRFAAVEDLMKVSGIGPKIFANLKEEIRVQ